MYGFCDGYARAVLSIGIQMGGKLINPVFAVVILS
jgi:hypothetical protein